MFLDFLLFLTVLYAQMLVLQPMPAALSYVLIEVVTRTMEYHVKAFVMWKVLQNLDFD